MQVIERRPDGRPKVVELTDLEQEAHDYFDDLLDQGYTIHEAKRMTSVAYEEIEDLTALLAWLG